MDENFDTDMRVNQTEPQMPPRLKKIKKLIKRNPDGSIVQPSMPRREEIENEVPVDDDNFNLDEYLDEEETPASLPSVQQRVQQPQFIDEIEDENVYSDNASNIPDWLNLKIFIASLVAIFIVGFILAKLTSGNAKVVKDGLQGVVANYEVPKGRARCGIAEKTQGCVLYIMNAQRQEVNARDFYDLASQMTGRQRFVIETGNMRYSTIKIRPGEIAQFNIPPLQ